MASIFLGLFIVFLTLPVSSSATTNTTTTDVKFQTPPLKLGNELVKCLREFFNCNPTSEMLGRRGAH